MTGIRKTIQDQDMEYSENREVEQETLTNPSIMTKSQKEKSNSGIPNLIFKSGRNNIGNHTIHQNLSNK